MLRGYGLSTKLGLLALLGAALQISGCKTDNYPEVRGHTIGERGRTAVEKLEKAGFRSRLAWDGTLLLGEGNEKECDTTFDFPGKATPCQSMRLQFTFPLEGSGTQHADADSDLYSVQYFQRPENPVASSVWLSEVQGHFGELTEVSFHRNTVQELDSRRYVRVLSGPYQPADLDILKEYAVAAAELAKGCTRPVAMARVHENRRGGMTLSYGVTVMDVQRLCKRQLAIEKMRAAKGGSPDQLKFK